MFLPPLSLAACAWPQCWYGIMGLSAVCHTLNPRLFAKDLKYIIGHAGTVRCHPVLWHSVFHHFRFYCRKDYPVVFSAGDKYILADISFVQVVRSAADIAQIS